jgi:4-hydroxy-tetrahydrodipicolinate reductase
MKIALLGYGKMGRMIEAAAARHALDVVCIIDPIAGGRGDLADADVGIDFTQPDAVIDNIKRCAEAKKPVVIGTTGWYDKMGEVRAIVEASDIGLIYGSNFSIGVNLMFKLVQRAAELFKGFEMYDAFLEEAHHKFKLDAPSGTAYSLKKIVEGELGRAVPTASTRAGYIPGTHTVGFDSEVDTLTITHTARSRAGFAEGAIVAATWIAARKGFYEFSQIF